MAPFGSLCSTKIEAARLSPRRDFVETEAETVFPIYLCFRLNFGFFLIYYRCCFKV